MDAVRTPHSLSDVVGEYGYGGYGTIEELGGFGLAIESFKKRSEIA